MLFVFFESLNQFLEFSIVTHNSQRKVCVPFINFNYVDYKNTPSSLFKDNWTISSNRILLSVILLHATSHERERCKEEKRWTLLPRDSGSRCSQAKTTDPCRPSRANTPLSQPHIHTHILRCVWYATTRKEGVKERFDRGERSSKLSSASSDRRTAFSVPLQFVESRERKRSWEALELERRGIGSVQLWNPLFLCFIKIIHWICLRYTTNDLINSPR